MNSIIACLSDLDLVIRKMGVKYILQARNKLDMDKEPRKFVPPQVNFDSKVFWELVDLEGSENTEPPLTRDLPESEILSALSEPLILPPYPNHTQAVERMVKVLIESCSKSVRYNR